MAQAWQSFLRFELQASMAHKEERARAAEVADRTLLIADYEAQLAAHASEIQALREELEQRTSVLQAEMDRWGEAELVALRVTRCRTGGCTSGPSQARCQAHARLAGQLLQACWRAFAPCALLLSGLL